MGGIDTAHIETTLSVARQLDRVALERMEPFGRIRMEKGEEHDVIGRCLDGGSLAVSSYRPMPRVPYFDAADLNEPVILCRYHARFVPGHFTASGAVGREDSWSFAGHPNPYRYRELSWEGHLIHVDNAALVDCGQDGHHKGVDNRGRCLKWDANGNGEIIAEAVAVALDEFPRHQQVAALPLIVLAGLR